MKNVKKITRLRLDKNGTDEFILIGLVSAEPDYKISLAINKKLHISLKNSDPVKIDDGKTFSSFAATGTSGITYTLISNRTDNDMLLGKFKNVDYVFVVHDPEKEMKTKDLVISFRQTEYINAAFIMDPDSVKDKNFQYLIH
ncbi:MAG TPA: IPExxxVDY family protein [Bacteroidales bacterium]|nr:IPExxxVDY family protein [Bacteroidales bacterium]